MKKYGVIAAAVFLLLLSSAAYCNVTEQVISRRAEAEQLKLELVMSRFRSWYFTEKLDGNNPDSMSVDQGIFQDTGYMEHASYDAGRLSVNLDFLPLPVKLRLRESMRLEDIGESLVVSVLKDGSNTEGGDVDTSAFIQTTGGTFLPGANLNFTSGGINMATGSTLNIKDININGLALNDMSGLVVEGVTVKNPSSITGRIIGDMVPFEGSFLNSAGQKIFSINSLGNVSFDRVSSFGTVTLPYGALNSTNLEITGDNFTMGTDSSTTSKIMSYEDGDLSFVSGNPSRINYGLTIKTTDKLSVNAGADININAGEGTSNINLTGSKIVLDGHTFFGSEGTEISFSSPVTFTGRVYMNDYITSGNLVFGKAADYVKLDKVTIDREGMSAKGSFDVKANSLKVNGRDVVTADAKVYAAFNSKVPFTIQKSSVSGNSSLSQAFQNYDLFVKALPYFKLSSSELENTKINFSLETGIRNARTEIPVSLLPNLDNAVVYENVKNASVQLYLPEGPDGIRIWLTRMKVPVLNNSPLYNSRSLYVVKMVDIDSMEMGYVINYSGSTWYRGISQERSCTVLDNNGNVLKMLVTSETFKKLCGGEFSKISYVWQPFAVISDATGSDIPARVPVNEEYRLTEEETSLYYEALSSGDYVKLDGLPLVWPVYTSSVEDVCFVTVDEDYSADGRTVNNADRLYQKCLGEEAETFSEPDISIPPDVVSLTSQITSRKGNFFSTETIYPTATVNYDEEYWRRAYDITDTSYSNIVSMQPVQLPKTDNLGYGLRYCYLTNRKERYNDRLVQWLFSTAGSITGSNFYKLDKKEMDKTPVDDLIYAYGSDICYYKYRDSPDAMLFSSGFTDANLAGKLYDVEIEMTSRKVLRKKFGQSTVNLVKNVEMSDNVLNACNFVKDEDYITTYNTISTSTYLPQTARDKFLTYDLYHDNLTIKGALLPMSVFLPGSSPTSP